MRMPPELKIFKGIWIYFVGLLIATAALLTLYHLDPSTPKIALE
ncbi:hypothetical protein [Microvirga sp. TS319]